VLITSVKANFFSPALVSKKLYINIDYDTTTLKVEIRDQKALLLAEIIFVYRYEELLVSGVIPNSYNKAFPDSLDIKDVTNLEGQSRLHLDKTLCLALFPALAGLSDIQIAEILSWTWIVGMKCPGRQSIFSGLDMSLGFTEDNLVTYKIKRVIEKFCMVDIEVRGPSLKGTLSTLFRPVATSQPSISEIIKLVKPGSFKDLKALIIGGSRGIGETTAKIVAAGGGESIITYNTGKEDAENVRDEIYGAGFCVDLMALDIAEFESSLKRILEKTEVNAVFYYPSPRILRSNGFDKELFRNFLFYYVEQFESLVKAITSSIASEIVVFYPSTVSITEKTPGFTEYIMAKSAGEYLCESLARDFKNINLYIERLPRLQTDQTMNLQNTPSKSTSEVMLPVVMRISDMVSKS
jgi:hypothetical protein